jgi:chaperone modulatory protein CbpM
MSGENGLNDMSTEPASPPARGAGALRGIILDEQSVLTLTELSHACSVQTGYIIELVDEGLLTPDIVAEENEPRQNEPQHWRFSGTQMRRARVAMRLQSDLGINLAGVALALQLLDEIENLRAQVKAMDYE